MVQRFTVGGVTPQVNFVTYQRLLSFMALMIDCSVWRCDCVSCLQLNWWCWSWLGLVWIDCWWSGEAQGLTVLMFEGILDCVTSHHLALQPSDDGLVDLWLLDYWDDLTVISWFFRIWVLVVCTGLGRGEDLDHGFDIGSCRSIDPSEPSSAKVWKILERCKEMVPCIVVNLFTSLS